MHEISQISGRDEVFVAGKPAWHGLGVRVEEAQTAESAIRLAGLDWSVEQRSLHLPDGQLLPDKVANVRIMSDGSDCYRQTRAIRDHRASRCRRDGRDPADPGRRRRS